MKKFIVKNRHTDEVCGRFDTKEAAVEEMMDFISNHNEDLKDGSDDEEYLTPFDLDMEEIDEKEINELVTSFEEARDYLGGKPNKDFTVSKKLASNNAVELKDVATLIEEINHKHIKVLIAMNKLFTIAQAWNKADNFVPDFSDCEQDKWFPWFVYDNGAAGFVFADTYSAPSNANASFGSRLCFKSPNRARQFGVQFIDLWNDVLLFR